MMRISAALLLLLISGTFFSIDSKASERLHIDSPSSWDEWRRPDEERQRILNIPLGKVQSSKDPSFDSGAVLIYNNQDNDTAYFLAYIEDTYSPDEYGLSIYTRQQTLAIKRIYREIPLPKPDNDEHTTRNIKRYNKTLQALALVQTASIDNTTPVYFSLSPYTSDPMTIEIGQDNKKIRLWPGNNGYHAAVAKSIFSSLNLRSLHLDTQFQPGFHAHYQKLLFYERLDGSHSCENMQKGSILFESRDLSSPPVRLLGFGGSCFSEDEGLPDELDFLTPLGIRNLLIKHVGFSPDEPVRLVSPSDNPLEYPPYTHQFSDGQTEGICYQASSGQFSSLQSDSEPCQEGVRFISGAMKNHYEWRPYSEKYRSDELFSEQRLLRWVSQSPPYDESTESPTDMSLDGTSIITSSITPLSTNANYFPYYDGSDIHTAVIESGSKRLTDRETGKELDKGDQVLVLTGASDPTSWWSRELIFGFTTGAVIITSASIVTAAALLTITAIAIYKYRAGKRQTAGRQKAYNVVPTTTTNEKIVEAAKKAGLPLPLTDIWYHNTD